MGLNRPQNLSQFQNTEATVFKFLPDRQFGFMKVPGIPENVFFHLNNLFTAKFDGTEEIRWGFLENLNSETLNPFFYQKMAVQQIEKGQRGYKVNGVVTNLAQLNATLLKIKERPNYRLVERTGDHPRRKLHTGREYEYRILLTSKSIGLFKMMYGRENIVDPDKIKTGTVHYFQKEVEGEWFICDDPRI
jgi:hypothetical protein